MDRAGLENMLMNYYRAVDKTKIQFDFLTHRPTEGAYDQEIESMGGKIYRAPRLYPQNYKNYFNFMREFFKEHTEYKIVHSHIDSMSYLPLLAAKRAGVPIRIAHSHSTSTDFGLKYPLKMFFRAKIPSVATNYAACTTDAGEYLFPKKQVMVIPNAINIEKYYFNEKVRREKRKELGLEKNYVIGHVGRFTRAKNHVFLIESFAEVVRKCEDVRLLLIGAGELEKNIRELILKKKLDNYIMILSKRDDVAELYQAMDIFAFPSLYEGLGMGAVEAQVSGLRCLVSDRVPWDAKISENTEFLPLEKNVWVDKLLGSRIKNQRETNYSEMYDVKKATVSLQEYYRGFLGDEN